MEAGNIGELATKEILPYNGRVESGVVRYGNIVPQEINEIANKPFLAHDPLNEVPYQPKRRTDLEPEKRLMLAVLEDAIAMFQKYVTARDSKGKALFRGAEEYILEKDSDWLFSFENICDFLSFDVDYLRKGLLKLEEKLRSSNQMVTRKIHRVR